MKTLIALVFASLSVFLSAEGQHHSSSDCHRAPCCGCPREKGLKRAKDSSQSYLDLLAEGLVDAAFNFETSTFRSTDAIIPCPYASQCYPNLDYGDIFDLFQAYTAFERGPIVEASYQHDGSILVSAPYNFYISDFDSLSFNILLRWIWTEDCLLKLDLASVFDVRCPANLRLITAENVTSCPPPTQTYTPPYTTGTTTITSATGTTTTFTSTIVSTSTAVSTSTTVSTSTSVSTSTRLNTTTSTVTVTNTITRTRP